MFYISEPYQPHFNIIAPLSEETANRLIGWYTTQIDSPLLSLPGELRNKIYAYIIGERAWRFGTGPHATRTIGEPLLFHLACRQMYAEGRNLPYAWGDFHIYSIFIFKSWVSSRTLRQLWAITEVNLHMSFGLMYSLDGDMSQALVGDGSVDVTYNFLAQLPRLEAVTVYIQGLQLLKPPGVSRTLRNNIPKPDCQEIAEVVAERVGLRMGGRLRINAMWALAPS